MKLTITSSVRQKGPGHEHKINNIKVVRKKLLTILLLCVFLMSCGPKRMSCYSKRCVETSVKKDITNPTHTNS